MNLSGEIRSRFVGVLSELSADPAPLLDMIRPTQDAKFGDYQANCAMPLQKALGLKSRDVAARIVEGLDLGEMCTAPEIAGPGFINLRLEDEWLKTQLHAAARDDRLGVASAQPPRTYVIDFSSPNVAKPMHVGHIRSTVIGDALCRTLSFLGHRVISDNHLGDWGTQFGMIIYGYKHLVDETAFAASRVEELGRLYRVVNQFVEYWEIKNTALDRVRADLDRNRQQLGELENEKPPAEKAAKKSFNRKLADLRGQVADDEKELDAMQRKLSAIESSPSLRELAEAHPNIGRAVRDETAKLHQGDAENLKLWNDFLPSCREALQRVYDRLGVTFDFEYGESHYHDDLPCVVSELLEQGLARESDGALCVFMDNHDTPMIIQKQDGAYLYSTSDLATIRFRQREWSPDEILYVVDHRQHEHFQKLFDAARLWGYDDVELRHIQFGTVLGEDGKPYRTREGVAESLDSLLDEAVTRAAKVVESASPDLPDEDKAHIAEVVGYGAIKYRDLSNNRTSDYKFDFDKMLALNGDTATYLQYSHARVCSIFVKGGFEAEPLRSDPPTIIFDKPIERALALQLLRFEESLQEAMVDYRPNLLTAYLFSLAAHFARFFDQCHVIKADSDELKRSRLLLCDLTRRTLKKGLELLGIEVVDRM